MAFAGKVAKKAKGGDGADRGRAKDKDKDKGKGNDSKGRPPAADSWRPLVPQASILSPPPAQRPQPPLSPDVNARSADPSIGE